MREKPIDWGFVVGIVAYVLYAVGCPHIPRTTHYSINFTIVTLFKYTTQ